MKKHGFYRIGKWVPLKIFLSWRSTNITKVDRPLLKICNGAMWPCFTWNQNYANSRPRLFVETLVPCVFHTFPKDPLSLLFLIINLFKLNADSDFLELLLGMLFALSLLNISLRWLRWISIACQAMTILDFRGSEPSDSKTFFRWPFSDHLTTCCQVVQVEKIP